MERGMLDKDFWILLADDSYLELQICDFCDAGFILAKVPVKFQLIHSKWFSLEIPSMSY